MEKMVGKLSNDDLTSLQDNLAKCKMATGGRVRFGTFFSGWTATTSRPRGAGAVRLKGAQLRTQGAGAYGHVVGRQGGGGHQDPSVA